VTAAATVPAWVDVDMRHLDVGRRTNDWWTAFYARTPNRTLATGHIRVPCDNAGAARNTADLLAAFGIPRGALTVGGGQS
jgi:hypothetical protein